MTYGLHALLNLLYDGAFAVLLRNDFKGLLQQGQLLHEFQQVAFAALVLGFFEGLSDFLHAYFYHFPLEFGDYAGHQGRQYVLVFVHLSVFVVDATQVVLAGNEVAGQTADGGIAVRHEEALCLEAGFLVLTFIGFEHLVVQGVAAFELVFAQGMHDVLAHGHFSGLAFCLYRAQGLLAVFQEEAQHFPFLVFEGIVGQLRQGPGRVGRHRCACRGGGRGGGSSPISAGGARSCFLLLFLLDFADFGVEHGLVHFHHAAAFFYVDRADDGVGNHGNAADDVLNELGFFNGVAFGVLQKDGGLETDFIRFKTSILLKDTEGDPIKKAQLIQDIVRSIAVIPNPIVRSVYVKECSRMMQVDEPVLYTEIGKIKKKQQEKARPRPTGSYGGGPTAPAASPASTAVPADSARPLPELTDNPLENEEREVLRFLLKYGEQPLGAVEAEGETREMTVGQYIVHALREDELESRNPLHNEMLEAYESQHQKAGFQAQRFFVSHSNPAISSLASDLIAREYHLSRIHNKYGQVNKDEDVLPALVPRVVTELKWKMVKIRMEEVRQALKEAQDQGREGDLLELMQQLALLQQAFKIISQQHGERTII